jgi:malate dehydrogenase (oxaloacetate-decarboxylating)
MEGKAMLFKHFANIDAVPIVLDVHTADEIVAAVVAIAPSFGGINLEDISAPICFEVEERVKAALDIPVMHDDQHGTAIVVLAGLINACKVTGKDLKKCKIVCVGAGAAGTAVMKLINYYAAHVSHVDAGQGKDEQRSEPYREYGKRAAESLTPSGATSGSRVAGYAGNQADAVRGMGAKPEILMVDSQGIVSRQRTDLNDEKKKLLYFTNPKSITGSLVDALKGADIFIGVSKAGLLTSTMVKSMAPDPIIFAMANPTPEIMPDEAKKAGAAVIATGRSDFPNQVNNALAFPGVFRGALDNKVRKISDVHKIAAAEAIASLVKKPTADHIIPSVLEKRLVPAIASVIV